MTLTYSLIPPKNRILLSVGKEYEGLLLGTCTSVLLSGAVCRRMIKTDFAFVPTSIFLSGLAGLIVFGYNLYQKNY